MLVLLLCTWPLYVCKLSFLVVERFSTSEIFYPYCIYSLTRSVECSTISSHLVPNIITHLCFARHIACYCCPAIWIALYFVACCSCLAIQCYSFCYVDTIISMMFSISCNLHFAYHSSLMLFISICFSRSDVCPCLHLSISVCINLHFSFCYDISLVTNVKCLKNFFAYGRSFTSLIHSKNFLLSLTLTLDIVFSLISFTLQSKLDWH